MKKLLLVGLLLPTVLLSQTSVKDTIQKVKEITVVRTVNKESTTELVRLQRTNISSVDGINAETFRRTPDSKVSDVFKRVTGISVVDNRFVVVRGLNDRYNFALLNGLPLPSSESDKRAFSFDIFPSNMVDNLLVIKPTSLEETGDLFVRLIPEADLIVVDSIVGLIPEEEIDRDTNQPTMGLQARINSLITRKIYKAISGQKTTLLFTDI